MRLRPERRNHVWSYDFVSARTHDGRSVRLLNLIDEHTRESLLVRAERRWSSARVIGALADVMVIKGVPEHLRSDNGPEFVAKDLRKWLAKTGAKTLYIEPGSPWENGYCESFNSKLRDEFLNGEIFYSMKELRVLAERWRVHYNTIRPHSLARLQITGARGMADKRHGAWRSGNRYALPTSPHPRRRLLELRNSCATLTLPTAQKIGHAKLGADIAVDATTESFTERIASVGGADVILNMVGLKHLQQNLDILRPHGRLCQIAFLTGGRMTVDLSYMNTKRLSILGSSLRTRSDDEKARLAKSVKNCVWPWLRAGVFQVKVDQIFPLDRASEAHRYLESGQHTGKVILAP